ncbi:hypothetical protein [Vibrio vulnificus]|uniref:hypothetical protein n=1 Tax=Vibrio vulnificus TaxID=672 RepID=UPI0010299524|nr:hypothetical protein [Vibrio vulnificus]RZP89627.1 hypothetical protein D8T56_12815 [Vibrio vulnificus]
MTAFYDQTGRTWKWKKNIVQKQVDERKRWQQQINHSEIIRNAVNWLKVQEYVEKGVKPVIAVRETGVSRTQYWKMRKEYEQRKSEK